MDHVRSKKSEISADSLKANRTSNGMNKEKVLNLAKLARVELAGDEAEELSGEFGAILDYVGEVRGVTNDQRPTTNDNPIRNVMREDREPHEAGLYTKELLEQAPARKGDYIKVKKIL